MSFVLFLSRIKTKKPRRVRPGFFQLTSRASHFWGKSGLRLCALRICFFNFARFLRADGLEQFFQAFEKAVILSPFGGGWLHPSGQQFFIRHLRVCVFIYACGYVYMRFVDMGKYKRGLL